MIRRFLLSACPLAAAFLVLGDLPARGQSLDLFLRPLESQEIQLKRRAARESGDPAPKALTKIDQGDSLALVALYDAAGGSGWTNQAGWLGGTVDTWWGIGVAGTRVVSVHLDGNNLVGTIPSAIRNLTAVEWLDLSSSGDDRNYLSGPIPAEIGDMTALEDLDLAGNELTGGIPPEIGRLTALQYLDLSTNRLTGTLPAEIGDLAALETLAVMENDFEGSIPVELARLSNLEFLFLGSEEDDNRWSGTIPAALGSLANLEWMYIGGGELEGPIPPELGNLSKLQILALHGNRLSGTLPPELGNLLELRMLSLGLVGTDEDAGGGEPRTFNMGNNLSGPIPSELGNLRKIVSLALAGNRFTGAPPAGMVSNARLMILLANCNQFDDFPVPPSPSSLQVVDVSSNRLRFDDLLPFVGMAGGNVRYAPQAPVEWTVERFGLTTRLSVPSGAAGDMIQWYRDGSPLAGENASSLDIPGADDESRYEARITNPGAPELTLTTRSAGSIEVTSDQDLADADPNDQACDVDLQTPGAQCTLRAALEIVASGGGDPCECTRSITFGAGVLSVLVNSELPVIVGPLSIDGGVDRVRIHGGGIAADGFSVAGDGVALRNLFVSGFEGHAVRFLSGGGHSLTGSVAFAEHAGRNAVRVDDAVTSVTVGGMTETDQNELSGGIVIMGPSRGGIRMLRNEIRLSSAEVTRRPLLVPIDRGADGPTCADWTDPETLPPPRILELSTTLVRGFAMPSATVVANLETSPGSEAGRYWSASIRPLGVAQAGPDGEYTVLFDRPVTAGARIVMHSVDVSGRTSELTQAKRPVIVLPGVGGTWLRSTTGDNLYIDLGHSIDYTIRKQLDRLRMDVSGTVQLNGETVVADEIMDGTLFGNDLPYRPMTRKLEAAGWTGHPKNENEPLLDLWRFPYDWRLRSYEHADRLRDLVERLTKASVSTQSRPAVSCEVDIVTHSNGGMVASAYVWKHREHSRNRVNRLLMNAAPYLGAVQVAAAHTSGYLFGIEGVDWVGPDLHYGRLTRLFRNLPNGYGLMPSRLFYDALDVGLPSQSLMVLSNLKGERLVGYDATFGFLTRSKTDATGAPDGLGRNAALWAAEQSNLHDLMNDWRRFDGPPQVFRHVGRLPRSTAMAFSVPAGLKIPWRILASDYQEDGDTELHVAYRERLAVRLSGWGDGTVPLVSATLGRGMTTQGGVGALDYSGVDESPWIEEFEYFPCLHMPMVEESCPANAEGRKPLDRMIEVLEGGSAVPAATTGKSGGWDGSGREVFVVEADAPIRVFVRGANGSKGEDPSENEPSTLPEVGLWSGPAWATISLPANESYTVHVLAGDTPARVQVSRQTETASDAAYRLFPEMDLDAGGSAVMALSATGTAGSAPFEVDADGDGSTEVAVAPAVERAGATEGSGVPSPYPVWFDEVAAPGDAPFERILQLLQPGADTWTWRLEGLPAWLSVDATQGATPAEVRLTFLPAGLGDGAVEASLRLRYVLDGFETEREVPVRLVVRGAPAVVTTIQVAPTGLDLAPGDVAQFSAIAFDQYAVSTPAAFTWTASGGEISADGEYTAGPQSGLFRVTATGPGGVAGSVDVRIAGGVGLESEPGLPGRYHLAPAYPNPFNPATVVPFDLPAASRVRLVVYDALGRTVAVLVDGTLPAGSYRYRLDAGLLAGGAYFVTMDASNYRQTRGLLLLR